MPLFHRVIQNQVDVLNEQLKIVRQGWHPTATGPTGVFFHRRISKIDKGVIPMHGPR
ncbi:hypothetical protein [Desulforapulum autotrophicum]|uniref:hypothetical protein n=1 Tax=Desulforapulum autotrophicum TaxID=2296 RepID=UPI001E556AD1|nr:hypothetical protein [Desulforapulum autotrophicum]